MRREQGVDDETVAILQVGRLERWKGHEMHLRALAELPPSTKWMCWRRTRRPQTPAEQDYLSALRELANQLGIAGRVRFLGQRRMYVSCWRRRTFSANLTREPSVRLVFVEALWPAA